jgi:hypothetical protein
LCRYETDYTLTISFRDKRAAPAVSHSETLQITRFFDVNGVFLHNAFDSAMKAFYQQFAQNAKID